MVDAGYSEAVAQKILRGVGNRGWAFYECSGHCKSGDEHLCIDEGPEIIRGGPVSSLEVDRFYSLFPTIDDPTNPYEMVDVMVPLIARGFKRGGLIIGENPYIFEGIHPRSPFVEILPSGRIPVPYELLLQSLDSLLSFEEIKDHLRMR
ncbi:MAG: hypothetical protein ABIE22_00445 [archaeon]